MPRVRLRRLRLLLVALRKAPILGVLHPCMAPEEDGRKAPTLAMVRRPCCTHRLPPPWRKLGGRGCLSRELLAECIQEQDTFRNNIHPLEAPSTSRNKWLGVSLEEELRCHTIL